MGMADEVPRGSPDKSNRKAYLEEQLQRQKIASGGGFLQAWIMSRRYWFTP